MTKSSGFVRATSIIQPKRSKGEKAFRPFLVMCLILVNICKSNENWDNYVYPLPVWSLRSPRMCKKFRLVPINSLRLKSPTFLVTSLYGKILTRPWKLGGFCWNLKKNDQHNMQWDRSCNRFRDLFYVSLVAVEFIKRICLHTCSELTPTKLQSQY